MTYSSYPPAPGRHHLGPAEGEPRNGSDRPGAQRDPAVWWGAEPAVGQSGGPAPAGNPVQPALPVVPPEAESYPSAPAAQPFQQQPPPFLQPPFQPPQTYPLTPPAQAHQGWPDSQPDWAEQSPGGSGPGGPRPGSGPGGSGPGGSGPGYSEPRPSWPDARPARGDAPPGWQPPYQGAAEFQREYVATPMWEPTPPPPPPVAEPVQRTEGEPISSTMRGQIVDRMIRINTSHALQAADRLGTKLAVGPHCLALFSIDNIPGRYQRLSTATRLILDGEDAENLPDLLRDLTARAREKIAEARATGRRWEPRTPLTGLVLRSEEFSADTPFIGIGVSTLDTPEIPWARAKQNVTGADGLHLRGQGLIYLHDGTAVHVVRRAQMASGQHEITATRRVDSQYPSRRDEHLIERATHHGDESWELMRRLHEVLLTA